MDYGLLCEKRDRLRQVMADIPSDVLGKFDKSFEIEYTHNSTAIEGNTLTLIQTKAILEDGLSVGGKLLREIYEVANHARAFQYVKKCIAEDKPQRADRQGNPCTADGEHPDRRRVPQCGGAYHWCEPPPPASQ